MLVKDNISLILANKDNYIRFGGQGIIDGLKCNKVKFDYFRIVGENWQGLILHPYRSKLDSILPKCCYNQEFEIVDKKEYKKLPKYH